MCAVNHVCTKLDWKKFGLWIEIKLFVNKATSVIISGNFRIDLVIFKIFWNIISYYYCVSRILKRRLFCITLLFFNVSILCDIDYIIYPNFLFFEKIIIVILLKHDKFIYPYFIIFETLKNYHGRVPYLKKLISSKN
jgi:hypothetical protein